MKIIASLIKENKFKEALGRIMEYEEQNPNSKALKFYKSGFFIDIGAGLKDPNIITTGLCVGKQNLEKQEYKKLSNTIHYNLANGYFSLYELSERHTGIESIVQSDNLQQAKFHYRNAIKMPDDFNLKKHILTNYGNCLDTLGRGIEALYAYDNALEIDKDFSMAIGNRAKALCYFSSISGEYRGAIYVEAYQAIKSIIDKIDLIEVGGSDAKKSFEDELHKIESLFKDKNNLNKNIQHSRYNSTKLSKFEKWYIDFCSQEKLFLNFHVHHNQCEASIIDPIFISMITPPKDNDTFYKLAKYINQIKEDYAVARLLFVQSQFKRKDFDRISRRTTFVNTLDYSEFNLYFGLLKSAFKEAYNILDKIAVFINEYFDLGLSEDKIYFTSIWQEGEKIREKLLKSENISLYALYDIYKDFKSGYYGKIRNIRNALTHRKLVIFDSALTDWDNKDDKYNIGYDTMLTETTNLLLLTKSAIIYLINFVNIEENKKVKNGFIPPIYVDTSQYLSY